MWQLTLDAMALSFLSNEGLEQTTSSSMSPSFSPSMTAQLSAPGISHSLLLADMTRREYLYSNLPRRGCTVKTGSKDESSQSSEKGRRQMAQTQRIKKSASEESAGKGSLFMRSNLIQAIQFVHLVCVCVCVVQHANQQANVYKYSSVSEWVDQNVQSVLCERCLHNVFAKGQTDWGCHKLLFCLSTNHQQQSQLFN